MTKQIQWEKVFDKALSRGKAEKKVIFLDFFNPQ